MRRFNAGPFYHRIAVRFLQSILAQRVVKSPLLRWRDGRPEIKVVHRITSRIRHEGAHLHWDSTPAQ